MKFGLFGGALRTHGRPYVDVYREYADYLVAAEQLGFESVFLVEHHFTGLGDIGASLTVLSHVAGRTSSIRLGTAVTVLPWHMPLLLAEQTATIDVLSGGRLDFGIGRGYRLNEFHGFCVDAAEATHRFDECIQIVQKAWTTRERFSFDGEFWKFRDVIVEPSPLQQPQPPVWVAAGSEASIKKAAVQGHNLLLDQYTDVAGTGKKVQWFRDGCEQAGRTFEPQSIALTRGLMILESSDAQERNDAIERRRSGIRQMAESAMVPGTAAPQDHLFFNDDPAGIETSSVIGTPDECAQRLSELAAVGVEYVLFSDFAGDIRTLETFAKEVAPNLP